LVSYSAAPIILKLNESSYVLYGIIYPLKRIAIICVKHLKRVKYTPINYIIICINYNFKITCIVGITPTYKL